MAWHWIDYAIMAIIGLSVLTGLFRGFVKELMALCVWVLAIWLAITYSSVLDPWALPYIKDKTARMIACFIVVLIATLIVGGACNAFMSFILRRSGLSGTDRILGMGFGFVRGIFIVSLGVLVLQSTSLSSTEVTSQSRLLPHFDAVVQWLSGYMPDFIKQIKVFDKTGDPKVIMDKSDIKPAA